MLPRIVPTLRLSRTVARQQVRCMSDAEAVAIELRAARTTMNDLPVPSEPFQQWNNRRQQKYNLFLAANIVAIIVAGYVSRVTGASYLHQMPKQSIIDEAWEQSKKHPADVE